jgi:two-component system phosphate regulon response regulator PhoB
MDPRILIADQDEDARRALARELHLTGFETRFVDAGRKVLEVVPTWRPRLVLLDLHLADLGGIEVVRRLKADPLTEAVPVMMMAHRAEEVDRVLAFTAGVDDFVSKPLRLREAALRCRAILRRVDGATSRESDAVIEVGVLRVEPAAHRVQVSGQEIHLTHLELRLLVTLASRHERVQSRERLLQDVWSVTAEVTTRTVDTHIRRLRRKIGEAGRYIETVRGVGYRFVGPTDKDKRG